MGTEDLRAGQVLDILRKNLIARHLLLLERSSLSFRLSYMTGVKFSVMKAGASVPELSTGPFIHNRIQLFWIPGQCGIIGNDEADGLAGVGSKSNFCRLEPCLPVSKSLMTRVTNEWMSDNHFSYWNQVSGCRQSKVDLDLDSRFLRDLSGFTHS
jgi:hypothetical protein